MFCQSRIVCAIFYDLEDIKSFIDKFLFADFEYAYIYHDKDKKPDGSNKEPHYHFYGRRKSPITEQSLKNFKKICKQNFMYENLKSTENALLLYFTHSECNDKYHYPISDIVSNFDIDLRIKQHCISDQKIDPSMIISMFDNGFSTLDIIRRFPKLIYSISNLERYEKLLFAHRQKIAYLSKCPEAVKPIEIADIDVNFPFE